MKAGAEVLDSLMMKAGAKVKLPTLDVGEFQAVIMLLYACCLLLSISYFQIKSRGLSYC